MVDSQESADKPKRGGARNQKKPDTDESILMHILSLHKKLLFQCGPYEHISKNQAASAEGLAHNYPLLKPLLEAEPTGEFAAGLAKRCVEKIVMSDPSQNTSTFKNETFSGLRWDRIACMLKHIRRLRQDPVKRRQACSGSSGSSWALVLELVVMGGPLEQDEGDHLGSDLDIDVPSTQEYTETGELSPSRATSSRKRTSSPPAVSPKRRLSRKISLDEDGFPMMLTAASSHRSASSPPPALPKAKAKAKAPPSPKARAKAKGSGSQGHLSPQAAVGFKLDYNYLFYHSGSYSIGIREKFPRPDSGLKSGKQIFTFKGSPQVQALPMSQAKDILIKHAKKVVIKLLENELSVEEVAAWAKNTAP